MVNLPSLHNIHYHARHGDCHEDQDAPIESFCSDRSFIGPETPEERKKSVKKTAYVDRNAEASEAPPSFGQGFWMTNAADKDAGN